MTSSAVSEITGVSPSAGDTFTEADWSDATSPVATPYAKSMTLTERAACYFVRETDGVIDPT